MLFDNTIEYAAIYVIPFCITLGAILSLYQFFLCTLCHSFFYVYANMNLSSFHALLRYRAHFFNQLLYIPYVVSLMIGPK